MVDLSQTSVDFTFIRAKSARNAVHIRAQKCCDINCTRPCFVLPSNCTRMLAHSEINNITHGKNSRKYGIITSILPLFVYFLYCHPYFSHQFCSIVCMHVIVLLFAPLDKYRRLLKEGPLWIVHSPPSFTSISC